jgi:DNA-binding NarL/FixJ family response regulator
MKPLSPRQTEVAALVAEGMSSKAIGNELGLSHRTVQEYIYRISRRLPGKGPPRWRIMAWYIRATVQDSAA